MLISFERRITNIDFAMFTPVSGLFSREEKLEKVGRDVTGRRSEIVNRDLKPYS